MSRPLKGNNRQISIYGLVQGVGFRPFVAKTARRHHLTGWVANTAFGASILAQGTPEDISAFLTAIKTAPPPLARISRIAVKRAAAKPLPSFSIVHSETSASISADLPADIALCDACRRELNDPSDRRFRYPFINCTDCGPRFSITKTLPYDRPSTTMASFRMCPACQAEYDDPSSRRFHAQPNACPVCGPSVRLMSTARGRPKTLAGGDTAVRRTISLIRSGKIIAIKSIGGYQLACDAHNSAAIAALRRRKNRPDKPFAVMVSDIKALRKMCVVSPAEEKLLKSPQAPIVLLRKQPDARKHLPAIEGIAPANAYLGVMLPYTPLHAMLFQSPAVSCLIMTSGNRQDEPICRDEAGALKGLSGIADYLLAHNRPIHNRCDDSIVQLIPGTTDAQMIRRSRGYVPNPVAVHRRKNDKPVFAVGAELKNTFCLTRGNNAYPSPYIGDLDNQEALAYYQESFDRFTRLLAVTPRVVACDLHPDYMSSHVARAMISKNRGVRVVAVQHHQAHLASACAEHGITSPVIGFAFDGTGLGLDGAIWGGECFAGAPGNFTRVAHVEYFPLPGGDQATKEIWRIGVSLLRQSGLSSSWLRLPRTYPADTIDAMIDNNINTPLCSSIGRLFDGVAALLGIRREVTFEAQAAMEIESTALDLPVDNRPKKGYTFSSLLIGPLVRGIMQDKARERSNGYIAYRFHLTLAEAVATLARDIRRKQGINTVVLSGGVFQNRLLLSLAVKKLKASKFTVAYNRLVPTNDGGISLGQAFTVISEQSNQ